MTGFPIGSCAPKVTCHLVPVTELGVADPVTIFMRTPPLERECSVTRGKIQC